MIVYGINMYQWFGFEARARAHLNAAQEELFLARLGPHTNKRRSLVVKIPTIQA